MANRPDRERERLAEIARAEQATFNDMAVTASTEGAMRSARIAELAEAQRAAYRRVSAARAHLTMACKDGSVAKIEAAAERLRDRRQEADDLADRGIAEMQGLISGWLNHTGATLEQIARAWAAQNAVTATHADPDDQTERRSAAS